MAEGKRAWAATLPPAAPAAAGGGGEAAGPAAKRLARLGDDRVAAMPSGANLIQAGGKSCTHEVCWPPGQPGSSGPPPPRPGPPARQWPFTLDPFQQTAINALEAGANVLVAAHTSAGKTVVAEYAFAMGIRDGRRVVYTSPLKALSNQKYRELAEVFGDVGLMTGDVTINPSATCLVMTTEILRSMLYRGSEVVREVGLLVYDEVHYLRDAERGVVWEESIILAPRAARMAFLSATIPNTAEFAGWVAATHGSPVHICYTEYRPTPLQHYLFPAGTEGLFMVVDEGGVFRDDNFAAAVAALQDAAAAAASAGKGSKQGKGVAKPGPGADIFKLVSMVVARGYDPLIVFSFSKRECEGLALSLAGLDLNSDTEKALVEGVFRNAVDVLSEADQRLKQIGSLLPMLKRGIGVHHSGLLPILKEVVELLFQAIQPGPSAYAERLQTQSLAKPLYQAMASGLTDSTADGNPANPCSGSFREDLVGLRPLGRCAYVAQPAFSLLEVDWEQRTVTLSVRNYTTGAVASGYDGSRQQLQLSLDTCKLL